VTNDVDMLGPPTQPAGCEGCAACAQTCLCVCQACPTPIPTAAPTPVPTALPMIFDQDFGFM